MYVQSNIVACPRNHCCSSVCIVELHVAVKNIKIMNVAQRFYGECMSPATPKRT
jgi:hypothetical protein